MACRWHFDKETGIRYHVPECWGTVHDPDGACYCFDRKLDVDDDVGERIASLEKQMAQMEQVLADLKQKPKRTK